MRPTSTLLLACALLFTTSQAHADFLSEAPSDVATRVFDTALPDAGPGLMDGYAVVSGPSNNGPLVNDALVKFAAGTSLPTGATIITAILTLTVDGAYGNSHGDAADIPFSVVGTASSSSSVSLADFGSGSPLFQGNGVVTAAEETSGYGPQIFVVTSLVESLMASDTPFIAFQIDDTDNSNGSGISFGPATLRITYSAVVPEPSSLVLVGLGVTLSTILRWKRSTDSVG